MSAYDWSTPIDNVATSKSRALPRADVSKSISPIVGSSLEQRKSKSSSLSLTRRRPKIFDLSYSSERGRVRGCATSSSSEGNEPKRGQFFSGRKRKKQVKSFSQIEEQREPGKTAPSRSSNRRRERKASTSRLEEIELKKRKLEKKNKKYELERTSTDKLDDTWKTVSRQSLTGLEHEASSSVVRDVESLKKRVSCPKRVRKGSAHWDDACYPWEEIDNEMHRSIEVTRDAPPALEDIRNVLEQPLFPPPRIPTPEVDEEDALNKAEFLRAPEVKTFDRRLDRDDFSECESVCSENLEVRHPVKTYNGPGPRIWRFPRKRYQRSTNPLETIIPFDWKYYPNYEANRRWHELMGDDAEARGGRLQDSPPKRSTRNREVMFDIRREASEHLKETKQQQGKQPMGKRKKAENKQTSTPMITYVGKGLPAMYTVLDGDSDSDSDSDNVNIIKPSSQRSTLRQSSSDSENCSLSTLKTLPGAHSQSKKSRINNSGRQSVKSNQRERSSGSSKEEESPFPRRRRRGSVQKLDSSSSDSSSSEAMFERTANNREPRIISKPPAKRSFSVQQRTTNKGSNYATTFNEVTSLSTDSEQDSSNSWTHPTILEEIRHGKEVQKLKRNSRIGNTSTSNKSSDCSLSFRNRSTNSFVTSNVSFIGPLWRMKKSSE